MTQPPVLKRDLGLFGAVMMGLGSIVGTGVFVSVGVAAGISGPSVILAIAAAGLVAMCNAFSSAQLAASNPVSGGTYEYGYKYLTPSLGFSAGWMFICAKTASAATAALGFAGYLTDSLQLGDAAAVPIAVAAAVVLTAVVMGGIRRSGIVNVLIVSVTLGSLGLFVAAGLPDAVADATGRFTPFFAETDPVQSFLFATALMFVAYTGYGRIATLGEEVNDPRRTIPRAIVLTLVISALLYIAVGAVAVGAAGADGLAASAVGSAAPLEAIARGFTVPGAGVVAVCVAIGAMTAMLGVLLNLILGQSRMLLAMARRGDIPRGVATLNAKQTTPTLAVAIVGVIVVGLTLIGSVKVTWSFGAFTILVYYAITNLAALRQPREEQLYSPLFAWCGLASCLSLAFFVEREVWLVGLGVVGAGLIWHAIARRVAAPPTPPASSS
jgi:APA family basic amino acid/polyamine antiporter